VSDLPKTYPEHLEKEIETLRAENERLTEKMDCGHPKSAHDDSYDGCTLCIVIDGVNEIDDKENDYEKQLTERDKACKRLREANQKELECRAHLEKEVDRIVPMLKEKDARIADLEHRIFKLSEELQGNG